MKHKTRLLVIVLLGTALSFFTISCLKESGEKVDLNLGKEGEQCRADKSCDLGLTCDDTNICVGIITADKCEKDADCKEGYECLDKKCFKIVNPMPMPGVELECESNADCGTGKYCKDNVCENRCPSGMAFISKGEFMMGSNDFVWSKPVHKVMLTKDFCMDTHEFTNTDKDAVKALNGDLNADGRKPDGTPKSYQWSDLETSYNSDFYEGKKPLVGVNWYIADRICYLQDKRLPTEAEWEYSARGGKMIDTDCKYGTADCADPNENNACWSGGTDNSKNSTCPVGTASLDGTKTSSPNAFGLYDMSGNVWEWVTDWYKDSYDAGDVEDPEGPEWATLKVNRGNAWRTNFLHYMRLTNRSAAFPYFKNASIGFRCVKELE